MLGLNPRGNISKDLISPFGIVDNFPKEGCSFFPP